MVGLGLGIFLAYRLRANRTAMFNAFKASEKPTHVQFAGGRTGAQFSIRQNETSPKLTCQTEPIPDLTSILKPSTLGDIATYTFFSAGGLFFGGEIGTLSGSYSASRTVTRDPSSKKRIEDAFRKFRAEVLRKEASMIESGEKGIGGGVFTA